MKIYRRFHALSSIGAAVALVIGGVSAGAPASAATPPMSSDPLAAVSHVGALGSIADVNALSAAHKSVTSATEAAAHFEPLSIQPVDSSTPTATEATENGLTATEYTGAKSHSYVVGTTPIDTNAALVVINSSSSNSGAYNFAISSAAGAIALDAPMDGFIVARNAAGKAVNLVSPAWAIDSAGRSLPTSYSVDGSVITQHVDLIGAVFPVVADPATACDFWNCTIEFNKADTKNAADYSGDAGTLATIACTLLDPIFGIICAVAAVAVHSTAVAAVNAHKCLGIRQFKVTATTYPVVYSGSYCR